MRARLGDGFDTGWIRHPLLRRWIAHCQKTGPHDDITWDDMLACCRSEEEARLMRSIALDEAEPWDDSDQAITHCFARLEFHHRRLATSQLARQIDEYSTANPDGETGPMMQKLKEISPATDVGHHFFRRS